MTAQWWSSFTNGHEPRDSSGGSSLGAAGEATGLDRRMRAKTSKERAHSLLNQGLFYFDWLLTMSDDRARAIMQGFDELLREQATFREDFGLISGDGADCRLVLHALFAEASMGASRRSSRLT